MWRQEDLGLLEHWKSEEAILTVGAEQEVMETWEGLVCVGPSGSWRGVRISRVIGSHRVVA